MLKNKKQGFTLIEMLVVVAIIGMLGSLIFGGLISSSRAKARDAKRISDIANLQSVMELYYNKYGYYPEGTINGSDITAWTAFTDILISANTGIGISKLPKDPLNSSGRSYIYVRSSDQQDYVLGAKLESKDQLSSDNSIIGTVYGISCGTDMIYCVKP